MRFEEDTHAGMRGELDKLIKRDWFPGSEAYLKKLSDHLDRMEDKGEKTRGAPASGTRNHGSREDY